MGLFPGFSFIRSLKYGYTQADATLDGGSGLTIRYICKTDRRHLVVDRRGRDRRGSQVSRSSTKLGDEELVQPVAEKLKVKPTF